MTIHQDHIPDLTTFYVYLTSGCNCACRHCYFISRNTPREGTGSVLAPGCLRQAITAALPLGLQRLKWTGGEPTLHPEFATFLRLQQEFGLEANLETNGLLVDEPLVRLMIECGVKQVAVSLDGARAGTHDAIRGISGGYARAIAGINALTSAGYAPELILTLQRDNVEELDEYIELAAGLGAGAVKINVVQPFSGMEASAQKDCFLTVAEILQVARRLPFGGPGGGSLPVLLDVPWAFRPLSKIISGEQDGTCNMLHILGVLPGGDFALCGVGQQVAELTLGRVMDDCLATLWRNHPLLQSLRRGLPDALQGVCGECLLKGACRGSCVAVNYRVGGSLFAPNWFCQQALEAGLFPASRFAKAGSTR